MAIISLSTLEKCNQALNTPPANIQYYQNIYVEPGTGMGRDSAKNAYWNGRNIDQDDLETVLRRMEDKEIQNLDSPITRNGSLLFHASRGDSESDDSASVFFRIYALTVTELNNLIGGAPASAVEIIYITYNAGIVRAKVRKLDGKEADGIEVNMDRFKITIGGTDYQLILDVVGIGHHMPDPENKKYRMVCYNNNVLHGRDIDLRQQRI